jgi:hypothetical protein
LHYLFHGDPPYKSHDEILITVSMVITARVSIRVLLGALRASRQLPLRSALDVNLKTIHNS